MNAKQRIVAWLASLAMAIMLTPSIAGAEEMSYSALMTRIDALESQLNEQHADFVSYEMGGAQKNDDNGKGNGKGKGGGGRSIYAGYEVTALRPYVSSNTALAINGSEGFSDQYGYGHRMIVGGEGDSGVGLRMRYWMFNHGHSTVPSAANTLNLDMDVLDLEATLSEELCNIDLLLSGGVRYGRVGLGFGASEIYFEGTGPTVALEASRDVGSRGLHLIGNLRASLLVGEIHDADNAIFPLVQTDDEIAPVLESQLGVGYTRCGRFGELQLRALWETQFWMNDTLSDAIGVRSNLALGGLTVGVQLAR